MLTQKIKLVMSQAQKQGLFDPQTPTPVMIMYRMQAPPMAAKVPESVIAAYHQRGVFPSTIAQTASVTQRGPRLLSTCGGRANTVKSGSEA